MNATIVIFPDPYNPCHWAFSIFYLEEHDEGDITMYGFASRQDAIGHGQFFLV